MHSKKIFCSFGLVFAFSSALLAQEKIDNGNPFETPPPKTDVAKPPPPPDDQLGEFSEEPAPPPPETMKDTAPTDVPAPEVAPAETTENSLTNTVDEPVASTTEKEEIKEEEAKPTEAGVEVEENRLKAAKRVCKCEYAIDTPYKIRRTNFGGSFGIQWGAYNPINYSTLVGTYADVYFTQRPGAVEVSFGMQWNFFLGSIGPQMTIGYFNVNNATSGATLTLLPVTAGITYQLNNVFKEPYVVPYGTFGSYSVVYNEALQGLSVKGNSPFGLFYAGGLMFQLDWMDEEAHNSAYQDYGIENTFLFVEARSFLTAPNPVPDMSTPLQIFAGLKTEF